MSKESNSPFRTKEQRMTRTAVDRRLVWLLFGVAAGVCLSYFWPHEPALASVADRDENFAMVTCPTNIGDSEAVFILDFLTGRLTGAVLNARVAKFTNFYYRQIAADFNVDPTSKPRYAIVSGIAPLPNRGTTQTSQGVVYIAELTTGVLAAYAFPFRSGGTVQPDVVPLEPIAYFPFRQAMKEK